LEEKPAGWDGLRLERGGRLFTDFEARDGGDAAVATGSGACSRVNVARLSLTGGLVGGDDLGTLLGRMVVSLRINVPSIGLTSDSTGRQQGCRQPLGATLHIFFGLLAPLALIVKILTNNRRNVNCEGINSGLYQKFYSGHLNPTPYAYIRQRDGVDDRTKAATLL